MLQDSQNNDLVRLAILPFRNVSSGKLTSLVTQNLAEDLILNFSKFVGISVISQYSTFQIQDKTNLAEIEKLKADYLVSGSYRITGENIKISVYLHSIKSSSLIFANDYEVPPEGIIDTQDDITQQLVNILQQRIDYDILSYSYKKKKVDLRAYENYLLGMVQLKKGTLENDLKAREYFQNALKVDPQFALAYTGLSLSYFNEWSCQLWDRWDVSANGAKEYALKSIELDPNDYISLAVLGRTYLFSEEFEKAEQCIRKSYRMNPNDAYNLIQVAFSLMLLGYPDESVSLYHKAIELNPFHEIRYYAYGANFYFEAGDFEEAIKLGRRVEYSSVWVDFPVYMAAAHYHLGDYQNMWENWNLFLDQFKTHIQNSRPSLDKDALEWHISVNPYKDKTNLRAFWDHLRHNEQIKKPGIYQPVKENPWAQIVHHGETWEIAFNDKKISIKHSKGLLDIAKLILDKRTEIPCHVLMGSTIENEPGIPINDAKSIQSYKKRISDLNSEISDAEEMNDYERLNTLRTEYDKLIDHLSSSMALGGKSRILGATAEKARSAVTWRIRSAIRKVTEIHPELGRHLSHSIKTGSLCTYSPESELDWEVIL